MRAAAATKRDTELEVNFKQLFDDFFLLGGVPTKSPYIIPFANSQRASPPLFNPNVAGTYSPSTYRPNQPFMSVVEVKGSERNVRYSLKPQHTTAAFQKLLYGFKVPVIPLAIFVYRDYGIIGEDAVANSFVDVFKDEFGFATSDQHQSNFDELFESDASYLGNSLVVEPFSNATGV